MSDYFAQYLREIREGRILVGRELYTELTRLESDLTNERYRYETADAEMRIKFIEHECKLYEAPWAGKPFKLLLWQKAFIEVLYSFKIFDNDINRWIRRFKDVLLMVARKNGKTPLVAAICLAEFYCGEMGTKIMCASNDYEQARLMFDGITAMREESPKLARTSRKNIKGIFMGNPKQKNARVNSPTRTRDLSRRCLHEVAQRKGETSK